MIKRIKSPPLSGEHVRHVLLSAKQLHHVTGGVSVKQRGPIEDICPKLGTVRPPNIEDICPRLGTVPPPT
ncbi:hypothetical protein PA25_01640 [Pseudoalteromonas sp. A25]|uniref:hypothetical protein n=1 Tax=Pseudoalteromonas sp. A25 TaxID=116092 RepID=UPI001260CECB|nr:hypothetical protein [Pseudoalteromonas sp. A25]BBN80179.1 hypothetical protein PA25_01640 [Pseudoalteromonas sp. A25]